jgi:hypothetical protein
VGTELKPVPGAERRPDDGFALCRRSFWRERSPGRDAVALAPIAAYVQYLVFVIVPSTAARHSETVDGSAWHEPFLGVGPMRATSNCPVNSGNRSESGRLTGSEQI